MPARQPVRAAVTASTTRSTTLLEALQLEESAASVRATEAKQLYSPAATWFDEYRKGETAALPPHMKAAFKAFCDDISFVARRHFEAYIRGYPRPPAPYMAPADEPATPPDSVPALPDSTASRPRSASRSGLHSPPTSYAEVALRPRSILKNSSTTNPSTSSQSRAQKKTSPPRQPALCAIRFLPQS